MKIGSIVECVMPSGWNRYPGVICPAVGKQYTVREFYQNEPRPDNPSGLSIYLEEIINKPIEITKMWVVEPSFKIENFRELLPPMDILREIEENTLEYCEI